MSIRPLMDTRPPGVSLEQIVLWVKCDRGKVCCHQHVGTQFGERPLARLDTVLRLAVLQDVDISRGGVGEPEPAGRIVLVIPGFQQ